MSDDNLPELRNQTVGEHLEEVFTAAVATVPFAGGVAHLLSTYRQGRFDRWAEEVERQLGELKAELLDDERFMDAFQRATLIALESHLDQKAEMLAAGLREFGENPDDWTDEVITRMFLMIERFTPHHISAMQRLEASKEGSVPSDPVQMALGIMRQRRMHSERIDPVAEDDPMLQGAIARDLVDFNLVDRKRADANVVFGGMTSAPNWYSPSTLAAEGQYLLRFLHYFTTDNEEQS